MFRKVMKFSIFLAVLSSTCAQSQDANNLLQPQTMEGALYTFDKRLTFTVQEENRARDEQATRDVDKKIKQVGDSLSGTWTEYDEDGLVWIVVGTTSPEIYKSSKIGFNDVVKIRLQKYSLAYLNSISELVGKFVIENFAGPDGNPKGEEWGTVLFDPRKNKIDIQFPKSKYKLIIDYLEKHNVPSDAYTLEEFSPIIPYATLYPGMGFISGDAVYQDGAGKCTIGYDAVIPVGSVVFPVVLTAGHCQYFARSAGEPTVYNYTVNHLQHPVEYIGEFLGGRNHLLTPNQTDAAFIANANFAHKLTSQIYGRPSAIANVNRTLFNSRVGRIVCSVGMMTDWRCGVIMRNVSMPQSLMIGNPSFGTSSSAAIRNLDEVNICGRPGDSGSPVLLPGNSAYGIYTGVSGATVGGGSGNNGNCSHSLPRSYVTTIVKFLSDNNAFLVQ